MKTLARLGLFFCVWMATASSHAVVMTYNAFDSGSYSANGGHSPASTAYTAGSSGFFQTGFRNFFVFDFGAGIANTVVNSATLRIAAGAGAPNGAYDLWSIEGGLNALMAGNGAYSDLGDGVALGATQFGNNLIAPTSHDIVLNPAAILQIDQAFNFGGLWGLGGVSAASYLGFLNTNVGGVSLLVDVEDRVAAVPSPATGALLVLGLMMLFLARRHPQVLAGRKSMAHG